MLPRVGAVRLYLPIVALVIYSFNDSPIPNVWAGFTLKWYAALAHDREIPEPVVRCRVRHDQQVRCILDE